MKEYRAKANTNLHIKDGSGYLKIPAGTTSLLRYDSKRKEYAMLYGFRWIPCNGNYWSETT